MLNEVCVCHNLHPIEVFRLALDFHEIRRHPQTIAQYFVSCCEKKPNGDYTLVFLPDFVRDYCLDVLAKRTTIPEFQKQIGG